MTWSSPYSSLLEKMWDTVFNKGLGGVFKPYQERREAKARIDIRKNETLALAQAEKEADEIRAGKKVFVGYGKPLLEAPPTNTNLLADDPEKVEHYINWELAMQTNKQMSFANKIQQEINVSKAILRAEEMLEEDKQEPSSKEVNMDWLFAWHEYAKRTSSEDLQDLWGAVLAGEVKNPGKFSLRTLEFIKTLSQSEAQLIESFFAYVVNEAIFKIDDDFFEKQGLKYSDFLALMNMGILTASSTLSVKYRTRVINSFLVMLRVGSSGLLIEHEDPNKEASMKIYGVTDLGMQIFSLGSFEVDKNYFYNLGREFVKKGFSVKEIEFIFTPTNEEAYREVRDITL